MNARLLFSEENIVSLRTAEVFQHENLVMLRLKPAQSPTWKSAKQDSISGENTTWNDAVWLYRGSLTETDQLKIKNRRPCMAQKVKELSFLAEPKLRVRWLDSGESVALYINEEPWAFIDESSHRGYSKGMMDNFFRNQWNQELFNSLFGD